MKIILKQGKRRRFFLVGMSSIIDLSGSIFRDSIIAPSKNKNPWTVDKNALRSDWIAIGDDLRNAIKKHKNV